MASLNFIQLTKISVTQGKNVRIENNPEILNDFFTKRMKVTVIKTRDCVERLCRLSTKQCESSYIQYILHNYLSLHFVRFSNFI